MVGVQCTREATAAPGQFLPHSLWSLPNLRPVAKETPSLSCLSSSHVQQVRPKLLLEPLLHQVNLPFLISISLNRNQNVEYMLRQSPDIQQMWDSMQNMWFAIFFPPSHSFELPRSFLLWQFDGTDQLIADQTFGSETYFLPLCWAFLSFSLVPSLIQILILLSFQMIPYEWFATENPASVCGWKEFSCYWRPPPQHWAFDPMWSLCCSSPPAQWPASDHTWPASAVKPFSNASSPVQWPIIPASTSQFIFLYHANYPYHAAAVCKHISLFQIWCLHPKVLEGNHPGLFRCCHLPKMLRRRDSDLRRHHDLATFWKSKEALKIELKFKSISNVFFLVLRTQETIFHPTDKSYDSGYYLK